MGFLDSFLNQLNDALSNAVDSALGTVNNSAAKTAQYMSTAPDSEKIRQGLGRFKIDMMKHSPFYGDILMKVSIIEDTSVRTAQTDGTCIRYSPFFFAGLKEGQRNYVILHEVLHILLMHWKRAGERDHRLWNVACDFVVNGIIDNMIWKLRSVAKIERPAVGCFLPYRYNGTSAEEYYARLLKENKGNTGNRVAFEGKPVVFRDDIIESDNMTEEEAAIVTAAIREMVNDVIKRRGTSGCMDVPSDILNLKETARRLPWNKLLAEFLTERVDEESSYFTPERKYIHMGLIVPGYGKIDDELQDIWAFVDCSGSIRKDELEKFMTQLYRIAKEFKCHFNIAFWDTKVKDIYKNVSDKEEILKCKPTHTGGTDINCIYSYLSENKIKPEVMIILTDGYFGNLTLPIGNLRKRTILVISEKGREIDAKNNIGRLACL